MDHQILSMTAVQLLESYRDKTLSPVEVTRAMLDQVERLDPVVNACCLVDRETTLARARDAEQRYASGTASGLVDGVPVVLTDVILTPMWPTLKGSRTTQPAATLDKSAPGVTALARHGYVPLGKTTTAEFGWKGVTDNPIDGVARNPWNPQRTPGGACGGSAAAVALGMAPLALGTDAGGFIRIPAAFCGVVGHKPSFGEVPDWPASPFGTLAHVGPMAWTVEDCALMMNVLSAADDRDVNAVPRRGIDYLRAIQEDERLDGLRIAFSASLGYVDVVPEVEAALRASVAVFEALGATVVETDPGFASPMGAFGHLFYSGAASAMRDLGTAKRELMDPELVGVAEKAAQLTVLDYLGAVNARTALCERMAIFHRKYDLLLTPTLPLTAFTAGREVPEDWPNTRWPSWAPFSYPFNMTGQPALSVPCGFDGDGLPIGLQLVGRRFDDATVLRAGHAYQRQAPLTGRRPVLFEES